jgi:hypothetical protein
VVNQEPHGSRRLVKWIYLRMPFVLQQPARPCPAFRKTLALRKHPQACFFEQGLERTSVSVAGKQAKTLMFVHVSPDEESYGETVSTLTFAKRVASVELGASSKNSESAELRESREKVRVRDQIPVPWRFLSGDNAS